MTKTNKIIILIIAFFAACIVGFLLTQSTKQLAEQDVTSDATPHEKTDELIEASDTNHELSTSAWIPDWASESGLESFQNKKDKIDIISPVWYELEENGDLIDKRPDNYEKIAKTAHGSNTKLIPAIAMFDHELFTKVLQSPENLDNHIKSIVDEVTQENYDGIDLDYESTKLSDKDQYFRFISKLSERLDELDKQLIITVLAKWGDDVIYPSLTETRQVQDWKRLSKYADQIRIMAYDFTFSRSPQPGPIAPLFWIEQILDYAVTQIPREKIILGIHLYSYEWWCELDDNNEKVNPNCTLDFIESPVILDSISEKKTARSYPYSTVKSLTSNYDGQLGEHQGERVFRYKKTNPQTQKMEERVLVYIDPDGIEKRLKIARSYGAQGVAYWRLGGELELI